MADKLSLGTIERAWQAARPQVAAFYSYLSPEAKEVGQEAVRSALSVVASEMSQALMAKVRKRGLENAIAGKDETT